MRSLGGVVAASRSESHGVAFVRKAVQHLLEHSVPTLPTLVNRGDRVLVKVNMGCSGARLPEQRYTTHPALAEAIIDALLDCGAIVSFGDDVARAGKYTEGIYKSTGMADVAKRTGASLIDFVAAGAREVTGRLLYPRSYLITNAYFEADVVINIANCRSHVGIAMSGAIKNMFGCVIGLRKQHIHNVFLGDAREFGRAIADIYSVIPADFSFLDLTSVSDGESIHRVGLILASTDAVALDAVAAHSIGYEDLPIWVTHYAGKFGVGCDDIGQISIRGIDLDEVEKPHLKRPPVSSVKASTYDRITAAVNNTFLRPRPVIAAAECTGCGECIERCPVDCIEVFPGNTYRINRRDCVDCGCCLKVCDVQAVKLQFVGLAKGIRALTNRLPEKIDLKPPHHLDPAPSN